MQRPKQDARLKAAVEQFDLEKFLKDAGAQWKLAGEERILDCPECVSEGYSDKLWINIKKKTGWCYVCEETWDTLRLIAYYLDVDLNRASGYLKVCKTLFDSVQLQESLVIGKSIAASVEALGELAPVAPVAVEQAKSCELPEEFIPCQPDSDLPPYFAKRGISREKAIFYKLGWCESGYFRNRMIVPVYTRQKLITFLARAMGPSAKKQLYPKGSATGRGLFNYDRASRHKQIVLTEGALDAIAVGVNAMALMGKSLSKHQALLLAQADPSEVVILLDGDDAGREAAQVVAAKLYSFIPSVKIAKLPDGKDPDEILLTHLKKVILSAAAYSGVVPSFDLDDF